MGDTLMRRFENSFIVHAPLEAVWQFHDDPTALPKVMTGPVKMRVHQVDRPLQPGSRVQMTMQVGPFQVPWNVQIRERVPMHRFADEQIAGQGPFKTWIHAHEFEATEGGTRVKDTLEYEPPFGWLGRIADALLGGAVMKGMFASRARATRRLLEQRREVNPKS